MGETSSILLSLIIIKYYVLWWHIKFYFSLYIMRYYTLSIEQVQINQYEKHENSLWVVFHRTFFLLISNIIIKENEIYDMSNNIQIIKYTKNRKNSYELIKINF